MLKILHLKKKAPKQVKYVTKIDMIVTNVLYNVKGCYWPRGRSAWLVISQAAFCGVTNMCMNSYVDMWTEEMLRKA